LQMTVTELHECIGQMRHANSDLTHVEAKAAAGELPKRLWETLSAFSNTIKGGTLVLGVSEGLGFKIVGVKNPKKLQQDLASLCDVMSPPIRAYIEIHRIQHKAVITAEIPEIPTNAKPCYYPGAGYTNGAFIRIADGDRKLSAYEVQMMLSARGQPRDDEEAVPGTTVADLQARSVRELLSRLRKRPGSVFSRMADDAILRTLKVLVPAGKKWVCSLGGILALGKYPQRFIPALDVLRRNMKHRSVVQGLYREDAEEYPVTAVREAIVNALAHRDLSNGSRGTPVQVQMFSDHLVVHNPGGLYGPVTVDSLGREGICATRNNMLLKLLEDVAPAGERQAVCENRGSGVGAMVASLRQARLPDRVTLSRAEISQALGLDISIRKWLATMRDEGIIVATAQKIRSKNVRYELARR
jgi:ATP-dependent DNA helicase RecG